MGADSKIEWTDHTWNPIVGCSVVSPGCTNCYAMRIAPRTDDFSIGCPTVGYGRRLTKSSNAGPVWTGAIRFVERRLTDPLRWRRPRMIFVNSMGDLFHESIPDEWIDKVFAVMALVPQHTFQVLTKRAERMREYVTAAVNAERPIASAAMEIRGTALAGIVAMSAFFREDNGRPVIENPFAFGDPRRARFDEGWRKEAESDGMGGAEIVELGGRRK